MEALSILIPVFDWDCSRLIEDLQFQGSSLGVPYEIIVADDCSTDAELREKNRTVAESLENCLFIGLSRNIGRASIRNLLADRARYPKLLFIDCDAAVKDDSFLSNYLDASDRASVICGGMVHPDTLPAPGVELRWTYERNADRERAAGFRNRAPYSRFTPFSFMIDRNVFMQIRFDASYKGYGYEDVQFGHELEKHGISVLHIDNPLVHLGLERNDVFMEKTRQAVLNAFDHKDGIGDSSKLLCHYNRLLRLRMRWLFSIIWTFFRKDMERNLLGPKPRLKIFSLYKLCYICTL